MSDSLRFTQRTKATGSGVLIEQSDPTHLLHLPDVELEIDLGLEEQVQTGKNPLAENISFGSYIIGNQPTISLTHMSNRPEVLELIMGKKFKTEATQEKRVVKKLTIPFGGVVAQAEAGFNGAAVVEDEPRTQAALVGNLGVSLQMTRVADATGPTAAGEFSVGAGMSLKFHADDVGKTVTVLSYETVSNALVMSEDPVLAYDGYFEAVLTVDNTTQTIEFNNATPIIAGNSYSPGSPEFPIRFRINNPLGECNAFRMMYSGLKVSC